MLLVRRFLPIVVPLALAASLEMGAIAPSVFAWLAFAAVAMVLVAVRVMPTRAGRRNRSSWNFAIAPAVFAASAFLFSLFVEADWLLHLLAILSGLLLGLYLEHLFRYFHQPFRYQVQSLEHATVHLSLISFFLLGSALSSFVALFHYPLWIFALCMFVAAMLLSHHVLWISKVPFGRAWLFVASVGLITLQAYWVLWFLPIGYHVKGMVLLAIFYLFLGYSRAHLTETLSRKVILRYAVLCGIIAVISLGTARWL